MVVMRFLFALMLGFLVGAGTMLYLIHSGAGDFVIRATQPVQDMERRLRDMETQRDQLGRQLEDVVGRAGRMESSFNDLERRIQDLQQQLAEERARGRSPEP